MGLHRGVSACHEKLLRLHCELNNAIEAKVQAQAEFNEVLQMARECEQSGQVEEKFASLGVCKPFINGMEVQLNQADPEVRTTVSKLASAPSRAAVALGWQGMGVENNDTARVVIEDVTMACTPLTGKRRSDDGRRGRDGMDEPTGDSRDETEVMGYAVNTVIQQMLNQALEKKAKAVAATASVAPACGPSCA